MAMFFMSIRAYTINDRIEVYMVLISKFEQNNLISLSLLTVYEFSFCTYTGLDIRGPPVSEANVFDNINLIK